MLNWFLCIAAFVVIVVVLGLAKKIAEISGLSFDVVILSGAAVVFFVLWKKQK